MMTANERRGLIALVALLALVVIIVAGTSRCSSDTNPKASTVSPDSSAIAADSLASTSDSIKAAKDTTYNKTKKTRKKYDINKANKVPAKLRDPLEKAEQVN